MRAGQTLRDQNNVEVALFPLEYMYISQGENGSYSHMGTLSIDFLGWNGNGRVYRCPYYAPVSCRSVYRASYYSVWQSLNEVITPTGKRYITFDVMHDNNAQPPLGTIKNQGELLGHTGTNPPAQVTGDHVHMNTAYGTYQGWQQVPSGKWQLINSSHMYDTFYVNDTVLVNDYRYNWKTYQGGVTPPTPPIPPTPVTTSRHHFKFVLFGENKRRRNYE